MPLFYFTDMLAFFSAPEISLYRSGMWGRYSILNLEYHHAIQPEKVTVR